MSERILALLVEFVTRVISAGGYAGIAALMAVNSAGIPLPSELIMPFSGYLVYLGRFNLVLVALAGMVGCNIGSAVGYWIGAKGGRPFVDRVAGFAAKFVGPIQAGLLRIAVNSITAVNPALGTRRSTTCHKGQRHKQYPQKHGPSPTTYRPFRQRRRLKASLMPEWHAGCAALRVP